jgi:PBP1b-binding outer membrane lipoprotein LpoB
MLKGNFDLDEIAVLTNKMKIPGGDDLRKATKAKDKMKTVYGIALLLSLFLSSCNSEPSLKKYFVENTENKNFIALDVSPDILNVDKTKLSVAQSDALKSFDKMNVLAFKLNATNKAEFEKERAKVNLILKIKNTSN